MNILGLLNIWNLHRSCPAIAKIDHADRLFNSVRETWHSAAGKANTSDVKELIPEFYYMPEFLENRFDLDLGEKQSGEKVCLVNLIENVFFSNYLAS